MGSLAHNELTNRGLNWAKFYSIVYSLLWIIIFVHKWGDSSVIFTSDAVISGSHCQIKSNPKLIVHCKPHMTISHIDGLVQERSNSSALARIGSIKTFFIYFTIVIWNDLLQPRILLHHEKVRHSHCDIILTNCTSMHKVAQSWYQVVNIIHEYQFLAMQYSLWNVRNSKSCTNCTDDSI